MTLGDWARLAWVEPATTTSIGEAVYVTVPPHKAGYGEYGVSRVDTNGHYYYLTTSCTIGTDYGTVSAKSPEYPGWNTWIGS